VRGMVTNVEHKLMTEREKADIFMKSVELERAGKADEAMILKRSIPAPAYLAKIFKDMMGADFLIQGGWNLAEAEAQFGADWLNR
jgi:hypothetical protein